MVADDFVLFIFIMGCDDDEKVREEEEKITMERINWLLNWMQKILLHPSIHSFSLVDSNNQGSGSS